MYLIDKVKNSDETAFVELFDQYVPVIYKLRSKYFIRDFDLDDWLQEGRYVLFRAVHSYEKGQGTTFGLYYKMIFENHIRSLVRRQEAKKRKTEHPIASIEKTGREYFAEILYYQAQVEEKMILRECWTEEKLQLSALEVRVLRSYLKGTEVPDIADGLAKREKVVQSALARVKMKIKQQMYG